MKFHPFLYLLTALTCFTSCKKDADFDLETSKRLQISTNLNAHITMPLDTESKIIYFLDQKKVGTKEILNLNIHEYSLGKHILKVGVIQENDTLFKEQTITFLAPKTPKILKYKVINSYPHDRTSFTQGLEFYKNELYEGTGQYGTSLIRKVDLETGKVLKEQKLADKFFGEGITIFNNQIHQLTWKSKMSFVYNVDDFKATKTLNYQNSLEGWGLTHNNTQLIKSDGSEKIWFLNPETGKEESHIEVYTHNAMVKSINELEYINGKIYANVWTKNAILIINPKNGAIESIVDMSDLTKELDNKTIAQSSDKVLNGIAYNHETNKLYVTGKNWDKLFEIEIVK